MQTGNSSFVAQLALATFYYHLKQMKKPDKYTQVKEEITAINHENKSRFGYRRIIDILRQQKNAIESQDCAASYERARAGCRVRTKKYRSYKGEVGKLAPNLLKRDFGTAAPNQK